jgi:hypothetical protein
MSQVKHTLRTAALAVEGAAVQALTSEAERIMGGRARWPGPRVPWWVALALAGFAAGVSRRLP